MLMRGGTKRDETRPTDGEIVSRTAGMLGKPLLPWQRYVADVAGEIDPATGTYYYDRVVLSTPRQCGPRHTAAHLQGRSRSTTRVFSAAGT